MEPRCRSGSVEPSRVLVWPPLPELQQFFCFWLRLLGTYHTEISLVLAQVVLSSLFGVEGALEYGFPKHWDPFTGHGNIFYGSPDPLFTTLFKEVPTIS